MNQTPENPVVRRIIDEMNALNLTLRSVDEPEYAEEALSLVRSMWDTRRPPRTWEDFFIQSAWALLLREAAPQHPRKVGKKPRRETILGLAWVAWSKRDNQEASRYLSSLGPPTIGKTGLIHLQTLIQWTHAIEALIEGRSDIAARRFQRAYEIGASFGTESHPIILWTMAASLFKLTPIC